MAVAFAMLAMSVAPGTAQTERPAGDLGNSPKSNSAKQEIGNTRPLPLSDSAAIASSDEDLAAENELLAAANKSRALAGVPPLRLEESLRKAAREHARLMVARGILDHQLAGELPLLQRIAQASALKINRAGENLASATCAPSANDVLMRSAPHRRNLLDDGFNVAGIAAFWSKGTLYVVQDFAHEMPSYSAQQSGELVEQAVDDVRNQAGLPQLAQFRPPNLDEAACSLAKESRPNARLLATAYDNRRIVTYTESRPEVLPAGALRILRDPGVRHFAVGSCYARNTAYPTGTYWVAILLY
jgi:uncharacterized protein YkwD